MLGFKIYISRTAEQSFRYYKPTPEEAESQRQMSMAEKRTRHSEMEKRFLHPALQHDKLYQVMVHKQQESLAREVLSVYPWFAGKHQHDGVEIKAVREENLEYDPTRDPAGDANWDARSVASTDMLGGAKSEFNTPVMTPGEELYKQWPMPSQGEYSHYPLPTNDSSVFNSTVNLPLDNPSTDDLINHPNRSDQYGARRQASRPYPSHMGGGDSISGARLLDDVQPTPLSPHAAGAGVPYPPSAFTSPPAGYTPPTMRRMNTNMSNNSDASWDRGDIGGAGQDHMYAYSQPASRSQSAAPPYDDQYNQGQYGYGNGHRSQGSAGSSRVPSRGATPGAGGYADPYDAYERVAGPPGQGRL